MARRASDPSDCLPVMVMHASREKRSSSRRGWRQFANHTIERDVWGSRDVDESSRECNPPRTRRWMDFARLEMETKCGSVA